MEEVIIYFLLFFAAVVFFVINSIKFRKKAKLELEQKINEAWGKIPERKYSSQEMDRIAVFYNKNKNEKNIDDITWNDLDMDRIFKAINNTNSSVGEEYLYFRLRNINKDFDELREFDELVAYYEKNPDQAKKIQGIYCQLGRNPKISIYDYIDKLNEIKKSGNAKHYAMFAGTLWAFASVFTFPVYGILVLMIVLSINIYDYFKEKRRIEKYFICFKYIIHMLTISEKICKENPEAKEAKKVFCQIEESIKQLMPMKKRVFLISSSTLSGSIVEAVMEYVRMMTHIDIIKFNDLINLAIEKKSEIESLYVSIGKLEAAIGVASFRSSLDYYCKPEFIEKNENKINHYNSDISHGNKTNLNMEHLKIKVEEVYHPLIKNAVRNSIDENRSVLITGSNASGKSTFLKTIAINALLSQTIYTSMAKMYKAPYFSIYSSMALRDDLENNESYYIVEIKSLKRILDKIPQDECILCFVDEVLRGTNTVERIAASSQILKYLDEKGVMCFAATHDIELTHILENIYSNYNFSEKVSDSDVMFNYKINKGRATTRNAIKLLNIIGFDKEIVSNAEGMAYNFVNKGVWNNCRSK